MLPSVLIFNINGLMDLFLSRFVQHGRSVACKTPLLQLWTPTASGGSTAKSQPEPESRKVPLFGPGPSWRVVKKCCKSCRDHRLEVTHIWSSRFWFEISWHFWIFAVLVWNFWIFLELFWTFFGHGMGSLSLHRSSSSAMAPLGTSPHHPGWMFIYFFH